ncbi:MAG: c-type cytochrome [Betaproteobacteria bacterium]|nr:c-type cytochrome [Betaproteobacteria bacterium]
MPSPHRSLPLFLLACLPLAAQAQPQAQLKSGEAVYRETCFACHAVDARNVPKDALKAPHLGDRKAWAPLIKEGQHVLTAHAWVGVRGMPARGGKPDLSLEEFARAVAYMARESGGRWQDPDARMLERIRHEEKKRLDALAKKAAAKK